MCYEFGGWKWKARAPEQVHKEVKAEKAAPSGVPAAAPKPAEPAPVTRVTEREKTPA
jgi:hypothetical protein